ncbi:MAG: putative membrane protein [Flavobacteriales bacterium]|jgi:uncharacterized membrane protein
MSEKSNKYLSESEQRAVKAAIALAEKNTSGEIRVHIEEKCKEDVLDRAAFVFEKLEMHKTDLRNGVLFYLATTDRKLAIIGDGGINEKVDKDFWKTITEQLVEQIKQGNMTAGLCDAIVMAGEQLKAHFPYQEDDKNELSDEISFA